MKVPITQKEIGERLRVRRKQLGLTIAEVAGRMGEGVADSTVQRTEVGTQNPTLETFLSHCQALEISPAVILDKIPLTIRPTVQEALQVVKEHIDIQSTIIANQERQLRETPPIVPGRIDPELVNALLETASDERDFILDFLETRKKAASAGPGRAGKSRASTRKKNTG